MITRRFQFIFLGAVILAGGAMVIVVRLDNQRLQKRIAGLRAQSAQAVRLQEVNQRTRALLMRAQADADGGARAIQAQLAQTRAAVGELEQRALENRRRMRAQAEVDDANLARNHDPEKGLTRLENFQDVGQAAPGAAFQTFVWAALKGEDGRLAGMIAFGPGAQEKAEAAVAALPEAERAEYSPPEKLAALFFAAALTAQPSAQILEVALADARHATVSVRGLTDKIQKVPMELGPQGWQIVVPAGMAEKLGGWAQGKSPPVKK